MHETTKNIICFSIIFIIVLFLFDFIKKDKEHYDPYLTSSDVKEPFIYSTPFVWNNPTRFYNWYYPLYASVIDPYFRYTRPYYLYRPYLY